MSNQRAIRPTLPYPEKYPDTLTRWPIEVEAMATLLDDAGGFGQRTDAKVRQQARALLEQGATVPERFYKAVRQRTAYLSEAAS